MKTVQQLLDEAQATFDQGWMYWEESSSGEESFDIFETADEAHAAEAAALELEQSAWLDRKAEGDVEGDCPDNIAVLSDTQCMVRHVIFSEACPLSCPTNKCFNDKITGAIAFLTLDEALKALTPDAELKSEVK